MFVLVLLHWVCVGIAGVAFFDALLQPAAAWVYAGVKRGLWLALTGGALLVSLVSGAFGLLGMAAVVASLVYLLEHRPKLRSYPRGRSTPSPWS
jgi:Protein of unknown function (DUF2516)